MTLKDRLEEAFIKGGEFYIHTPTFDNFVEFISLCKNHFHNYVPNMKFDIYDFSMWHTNKENTYLFYCKNELFAYGGKSFINNKKRYFLNLFNLEKEIIEHTYIISIGEYSGKLIIPKEALQELKKGAKLKLL